MAAHVHRHTVCVQKVTMETIVKYVSFRDPFAKNKHDTRSVIFMN